MTNNIVNHISTHQDFHTFMNGKSPIATLAEGIQSQLRNEYRDAINEAAKNALEAWEQTPEALELAELLEKETYYYRNDRKNFWGRYKYTKKRNDLVDRAYEIYFKLKPFNALQYTSVDNIVYRMRNDIEYKARNTVKDCPYMETIHAVLLTIPKLEDKSFNDIIKIVRNATQQ